MKSGFVCQGDFTAVRFVTGDLSQHTVLRQEAMTAVRGVSAQRRPPDPGLPGTADLNLSGNWPLVAV